VRPVSLTARVAALTIRQLTQLVCAEDRLSYQCLYTTLNIMVITHIMRIKITHVNVGIYVFKLFALAYYDDLTS
jgi:hypothetical protein